MHSSPEKKIKVVFAINAFLVGGGKQLLGTFSHLPQSKFDLHLLTLIQSSDGDELYHLLPPHVTVSKLNFRSLTDIASLIELFRLLRRIQPDVIVSSLFFSNTVIRLLKPFIGCPVITREHNTYTDKKWSQILVDRLLSPLSYKIVAVSTTVATFASRQARISPQKFAVIHNGVDLEKIQKELAALPSKQELKEKFGFGSSDKLIINAARLVPQKNHRLLIDSFARFSLKFPEYKLIVLGPGVLKSGLEAHAKARSMAGKIFFLGMKENLTPYYAASDFFVSTSTIEGLSNAYLEAMACGLPVVSTMTAGTDELIIEGKNGFFIRESSVEAALDAMEKMVRADSEYMKAETLKLINRFDIRATMAKYEALLEESYNAYAKLK